ncbi:MerR family transcriptional regulator [Flavobacterium faecale]|uniref:MerR family transcriptional regulator n=1 Tax=Flavobacterium faecale TaxID=1355330 RepID=A0A2S1LDT9_9FLAO|nr:chaperone modulator CbpM [Flavobacterium faecale]AWG21919.1 MerR family transcriptional regulator [Flavobacterium faecale]
MSTENFIPLDTLCIHYKVTLSFFFDLSENGLIDIEEIAETHYIHQDSLHEIEKIIRMHQDLAVNIEGIDVVLNLLQKIDALTTELHTVRNRLRLYEN